LIPKCRKAVNSICCHSNCWGVGTRRDIISIFVSSEAPSGNCTHFIYSVSLGCEEHDTKVRSATISRHRLKSLLHDIEKLYK
jgi:hypothetical protein